MNAKKEGRRKGEQRTYTERIILKTCEMQKPKIYSYLALHDGAIEKMLLHGTTATNTELTAEQGFDERFTQRALYGRSVHARSVPTDCVKPTPPTHQDYEDDALRWTQ